MSHSFSKLNQESVRETRILDEACVCVCVCDDPIRLRFSTIALLKNSWAPSDTHWCFSECGGVVGFGVC